MSDITLEQHLTDWANFLAIQYKSPVFLVGSAVKKGVEARDIDICVEMSDSDFSTRFGDPERWATEGASGQWTDVRYDWSDECVQITKRGWEETRLNLDCQVYPASFVASRFADRPKIRLDKL